MSESASQSKSNDVPTIESYIKSSQGRTSAVLAILPFLAITFLFNGYNILGTIVALLLALVFAAGAFLGQWRIVLSWGLVALVYWFMFPAGGSIFYFFSDTPYIILNAIFLLLSYGVILGVPVTQYIATQRSQVSTSEMGFLTDVGRIHSFLALPGKIIAEVINVFIPVLGPYPGFIDPFGVSVAKSEPTEREYSMTSTGRVYGDVSTIASAAGVTALPLYVVTLFIEMFSGLARSIVFVILLLPVALFGYLAGWFWDIEEAIAITVLPSLFLGFLPIILSLFHYLLPVFRTGAGAEAERFGARKPTRDEMEKIIETGTYIRDQAAELGAVPASPGEWRIVDNPISAESYTIGSTVYLTSRAVASEHLPGLIAHELGHLAHNDGDVILALRRLVIPFVYFFGIDRQPTPAGSLMATGGSALGAQQIITDDMKLYYRMMMLPLKFLLAFWFGGLGLLLMGRQWARFWRGRDFRADEYAVALGLRNDLMSVLEAHEHVDVAQPYLLTNRPYTAERLDRLKG